MSTCDAQDTLKTPSLAPHSLFTEIVFLLHLILFFFIFQTEGINHWYLILKKSLQALAFVSRKSQAYQNPKIQIHHVKDQWSPMCSSPPPLCMQKHQRNWVASWLADGLPKPKRKRKKRVEEDQKSSPKYIAFYDAGIGDKSLFQLRFSFFYRSSLSV